ncbi:MAG: DNA-formamidopyrimidine glycosylase [Erysipelotrichaceae bacterium]|nr:DNA-formamidopyrimidine glycosylase [Erysipelotrichaceae bacterium]
MPELPEVQTVLDTLEKKIKNRKIVDIDILYEPIVDLDSNVFKHKLIGQHFRKFKRRGKYLLFEMDDITFVSHLRMEGKYFILDDKTPITKHDHVIFYLDDNTQLRYNDVRKFGRMELIYKEKDYKVFKDLGPEPFSDDFNLDYCHNYLKNNTAPIKQILLNQSFVAGIGNIYADEILYYMKANPNTIGHNITEGDIKKLIKGCRLILSKAIEKGGTTIRSYTSSLGVTGRFQLDLKVHTKDICPKCKGEIKKIVVGGRGTYYCPNCQKQRIKIAITGTIGSGKSEASNHLRDKKGYEVFDCDETNRLLLEPNASGYKQVKKAFPECFKKGKLDKSSLAKLVFASPKDKQKLENIMHPLIFKEMEKAIENNKLFIAEVPLLFESKWDKYFDYSILLESDEKNVLKHLKLRGFSQKEAKSRINNQMSVKEKEKRASRIIYNNGSLKDLYSSIDETIESIINVRN